MIHLPPTKLEMTDALRVLTGVQWQRDSHGKYRCGLEIVPFPAQAIAAFEAADAGVVTGLVKTFPAPPAPKHGKRPKAPRPEILDYQLICGQPEVLIAQAQAVVESLGGMDAVSAQWREDDANAHIRAREEKEAARKAKVAAAKRELNSWLEKTQQPPKKFSERPRNARDRGTQGTLELF